MFPTLFELFGHPVNTYGVFVSLAHLFGISAVLILVRRRGLPLEPHVDLIFAVIIAGLVGARAGYILEHPEDFSSPLEWVQLWKGGLSVFAGLLLGFPAYLGMLWWRKMPIWSTSDFLVPILPLSLALVRIGCFGAGCCHGDKTKLPWGVQPESPLISPSLAGELIHPTQIYESLFLVAFALFLFRLNTRKPSSGVVVTTFLLGYGLFRFLTNPLRGDLEPVSALGGMSTAQAGAAVLILISSVALAVRGRVGKVIRTMLVRRSDAEP